MKFLCKYKNLNHNDLKSIFLFFIIFIFILFYRGFIILKYNAEFVDEDQALMWDGAVAFSHLNMPEPCFWGQSYGSMFESFLAAPLVRIGIPLKYAVPLSTTFIGLFPYLLISLLLFKKKHKLSACITLSLYLLHGWKWDIITSIPRSFICGFPFAVIGTLLLNDDSDDYKAGFGTFIAAIGAIMTPQSIMVFLIGAVIFMFHLRQKNAKCLAAVITGFLSGALIYFFSKNFYRVNQDFSLHKLLYFDISPETLGTNLTNIFTIFKDFIFTGTGEVLAILLTAILIFSVLKKQWLLFSMIIAQILSGIGLLSMSKTLNFTAETVLFSQTRLLICFSQSVLPIIYYYITESKKNRSILPDKGIFIYKRNVLRIITICLVFSSVLFKSNKIIAEINDPKSELNNPGPCQLQRIDPMIEAAKEVVRYADEHDIDVIIVKNDIRPFTYLMDALYYQNYVFYNITYDRRTWVYHYLQHPEPHNCLFVSYYDDYLSTSIIPLEDISVIQYIENELNVRRN